MTAVGIEGKALHAIREPERSSVVWQFVGKTVELVEDPHRDGKTNVRTWTGRVLAVAIVSVGTVANVVILDHAPGKYPFAFSLATVRSIREIGRG